MSFPDGSPVEVRYPLTPEQEHGDREAWPWLPGWVISQCGPGEWQICVQAPELAIEDQEGQATYPQDYSKPPVRSREIDTCHTCYRTRILHRRACKTTASLPDRKEVLTKILQERRSRCGTIVYQVSARSNSTSFR